MEVQKLKYFYEFDGNRELPEEEQGYALLTPMSAQQTSSLTNKIISESMRSGKKVKLDHASESLAINKRHIHGVFNVKNPIGAEKMEEMSILEVYAHPFLADLYSELSNAISDINELKEGLKKS